MRPINLALVSALAAGALLGWPHNGLADETGRPAPGIESPKAEAAKAEKAADSEGGLFSFLNKLSLSDFSLAQAERRRPGELDRQPYQWPGGRPPQPEAPVDPGAIPPPPLGKSPDFIPIPDRWRLIDTLGLAKQDLLDPYNPNILKGDRPIFEDYFVVLSAISDTTFEPRSFPQPVGFTSSRRAGRNDQFGDIDQILFNQNLILSASLIKGDTAFKPPDYELRLSPVFNINYVDAPDLQILYADPRRGTTRQDGHIGLQEGFLDYHLRNVSDRFDFDSVRVGVQPFTSDFRGFLFQDSQMGVRLFGNRENNFWQYNLAWFRLMEKDTNSGLNDAAGPLRENDVFAFNLYHQDLPVVGLTSQFTVVHNRNRETDVFFDKNGFQQRPAVIGDQRRREYDVTYLGANIDGHVGRVNLTGSFYYAVGTDHRSQFTGQEQDINAFFAAVEPSIDFDWIRFRLSAVYASGDSDPYDRSANGFDSIFDNPLIAGADTSYWIRQAIPFIGGGGVQLTGRNSLLPNLRSSKEQGQSNFVNPGLLLIGGGTDLDLTPELRLSFNANHMWFDNTSSLEALRNQGSIRNDIGTDLSAALIYRPIFIQNIVLRLSGAVLIAGDGFKDVYSSTGGDDTYYSVLANIVLTY